MASRSRRQEASEQSQLNPNLLRGILLPMRIFAFAWLALLVLYFVAFPSEWRVQSSLVILVTVGATAAFVGGYRLALKSIDHAQVIPPSKRQSHLLLIAASATLLGVAGVVYSKSLDIRTLGDVQVALDDMGDAYARRRALQATGGTGNGATLVVSAFFFLYPFAIPLGIVQWRQIPMWARVAILAGSGIYAGYFAATGTMKGFGDLLILVAVGLVARSVIRNVDGANQVRLRIARKLTRGAQFGVVLMGFLVLFIYAFASRLDDRDAMLPAFQPGSAIYSALGPTLAGGLGTVVFYVTNGFAGLGHAFEVAPPYGGYGGFRSISDLASRYLGLPDLYPASLPFLAEAASGYSATRFWWTIFPWIASDFGWVGVILFMGLLGFLASRLWSQFILTGDALSLGLFGFVAITLAYVPANNQVFMSTGTTLGAISLLAVYIVRSLFRAGRPRPKRPKRPITFTPERMSSSRVSPQHGPGSVDCGVGESPAHG